MRRLLCAVSLALMLCGGAASADAESLGDTLLRQIQRENARLDEMLRGIEREVGADEARLKNALKEKAKDKKGCKTLVCKGREDAAVLFARLNDALFRASLDAGVQARNYKDEADRVMRDIRFVEADMERSQSALFWRSTFSGLADFAAQMAYSLATGDATKLEQEMGVLAAAATEYAVNQQLTGVRGKAANEAGKVAEFAGLPPDAVKSMVTDWSSIGLFDVSGGKITGFRPKASVLDNPANAAGSVLVSKLVSGVIDMGHHLLGGMDFAANYGEKQRMYGKMLRNALMLRVSAALAEAQVKHLRKVKRRFNELFEREARVIAQCRREAGRASCEAAYRKALDEAARQRETARKAAEETVAEKERQLTRLKRMYIVAGRRYRERYNAYFELRRRWRDARAWQQDAEFRRGIEETANCLTCKTAAESRRLRAYYGALPPAAELERDVKTARKALLALGEDIARLEMEVDRAREAVAEARRDKVFEAWHEADRAYAEAVRQAERRLAQCMDVSAPEMHAALSAKAGMKRGKLAGFDEVMKPVHAAGDAVRRMFGKRAFDWRYAEREECRPAAMTFDFRPMEGVDGCWRLNASSEYMQSLLLPPPLPGGRSVRDGAASGGGDTFLALMKRGQSGELRLNGRAFRLEGGVGGDGMLHLVHRFTPASFRRYFGDADGGPAGHTCLWDMDALLLRCEPGVGEAAVGTEGSRTGRMRQVEIGDGEEVVGIDWPRAYIEWTFQPAMARGRRVLNLSGAPAIHLPTDGGFEAAPPMLISNVATRWQADAAWLTALDFVDMAGKPVARVREGTRVRVHARGKPMCPSVADAAIVKVLSPGEQQAKRVRLVETSPGSGEFIGPADGLQARLPAGVQEARITVTYESGWMRASMQDFFRRSAAQARTGGKAPANTYGGTVKRLAGRLSAGVLVTRATPASTAEPTSHKKAVWSYDGPAFEAEVVMRTAMPGGMTEQRGRMLMRPGAWRMEMKPTGMPVAVNIYREDRKLLWTLSPHTHTFMERVQAPPDLSFEAREGALRRYRYKQGMFTGTEWRDARGVPVRRKLRFPCGQSVCRMEMTIRDIRIRPFLDDSLFEIPKGYAPMASPVGVFP